MSQAVVLTKDVNNLLAEVDRLTVNIPDAETAKQLVARVVGIEETLRQMDHYERVACIMAEAEALLYVRICEQNLQERSLKGQRLNICYWVAGMTPEERANLIDRCRSGVTITYLYKNINNSMRQYKRVATIHRNADVALQEYKAQGSVTISTDRMMVGLNESHANRRAADAERDRVKDRLLRLGAVCIGDGKYVDRGDPRARKALVSMVRSIATDIESAASLAVTCGAVDALEETCNWPNTSDLVAHVAKLILAEVEKASS